MSCLLLCCFSKPKSSNNSAALPVATRASSAHITPVVPFRAVAVEVASDGKIEETEGEDDLVHTARIVHSYRASLTSNFFYTTPPYPYRDIPTNFNRRITNEIDSWKTYCEKTSTRSADPVYFKILQLLTGIECYLPIEIPSAAPAEAEVVIEADATEEEETKTTDRTESSDRVKVIFNKHLEVLVIACYAHKKSDQRILITSIVKNPRKLTCRESKGAATACVRAIAQEAFDIYGRQASLSCIGTGRGYHFFTDIGFLSADPIAKALLDMPPLILRHFLSKSHEQSVQVLNSTLAPTL